jgi:phage shock protein E
MPKPALIDLRETSEITANGTIDGSISISIRLLVKNLDILPSDKAAPIIAYCASGQHGGIGVSALGLLGYTNVKSISGGLNAWKAAYLHVSTK